MVCMPVLVWFIFRTLSQRGVRLPINWVNAEWDSMSTESMRSETPRQLSQRRRHQHLRRFHHSALTELTWSLTPRWLSRHGVSLGVDSVDGEWDSASTESPPNVKNSNKSANSSLQILQFADECVCYNGLSKYHLHIAVLKYLQLSCQEWNHHPWSSPGSVSMLEVSLAGNEPIVFSSWSYWTWMRGCSRSWRRVQSVRSCPRGIARTPAWSRSPSPWTSFSARRGQLMTSLADYFKPIICTVKITITSAIFLIKQLKTCKKPLQEFYDY